MVSTGFAPTNENPDYPFLDTSRIDAVAAYLHARNILRPGERIERLEPIVSNSLNAVVRVVTSERSLFLKQFRPWADPSPTSGQSPTVAERFQSECQFHRSSRIGGCGGRTLPALLHSDLRAACAIFDDTGAPLRPDAQLSVAEVEGLASFLVCLHHHSQSVPTCVHYGSPGVLRWQRERLFPAMPLRGSWLARLHSRGNGVRAALGDAAWSLEMGGRSLVHGDFAMKNWIATESTRRVVDAECSFFGQPELDVGCFLAELLATRQPEAVVAAGVSILTQGCMRYSPRLVAAFSAAHLCARFDDLTTECDAPRGAAASALLRRAIKAIERDSLEPFAAHSASVR